MGDLCAMPCEAVSSEDRARRKTTTTRSLIGFALPFGSLAPPFLGTRDYDFRPFVPRRDPQDHEKATRGEHFGMASKAPGPAPSKKLGGEDPPSAITASATHWLRPAGGWAEKGEEEDDDEKGQRQEGGRGRGIGRHEEKKDAGL